MDRMEAKSPDDFLLIYDKFATSENKSPRSIEAVSEAVKEFARFLGKGKYVGQIEAEDLRRYIRFLQDRPCWAKHPTIRPGKRKLSPHSIASYVRSIRTFWSWLSREGFIGENPFAKVKVPKAPRKVVNTFSSDQITKLLKAIPMKKPKGYRDYAIIIMLYGTGMRIQELLNLRLTDLNLESGQIKVLGKGARERYLYMSPTVYKVTLRYLNRFRPKVQSDYLFVHDNGQPLSRYYVAHRMQKYGREAGITAVRCSPHTLRHSFAINYLRNGGDSFTLQKILGHSTLDMTRHYAELAKSDVERGMKTFSPIESLRLGD
jgi:integrase/recombinase XerD